MSLFESVLGAGRRLLQVCRLSGQLLDAGRSLVRSGQPSRCVETSASTSTTTSRPPENNPALEEVGLLESPKQTSRLYTSGQCFLHRVFAYRGIILFPWKAYLFDRDAKKCPKSVTYYQVLVDERDFPHVRSETEMGNLLSQGTGGRWMFSIPGLDHVAHDDILPYRPSPDRPISHGLFDKFFTVRPVMPRRPNNVVPKLPLHHWRTRHLPWLQKTHIQRMTTDQVRVTAIPFYMGRRNAAHWWRYSIRIENLGKESLLLQGRRWRIFSGTGELETVRGDGVLGHLPVLSPSAPAIQYSSHVSLYSAKGHVWGYYLVQRGAGGRVFLCPVPPFNLESRVTPNPFKSIFS